MVQKLIHDPLFLGRPSSPAGSEDLPIARDLLDTLLYHKDTCVGMAANMIGQCKCIIAFADGLSYSIMFNPMIVKGTEEYETQESCLSLLGGPRKVMRYEKIKVRFQDETMQWRTRVYTGWTAQIIQHEIDHCKGILI